MKIQQMHTCIDTKTDNLCEIPTHFLCIGGFILFFWFPTTNLSYRFPILTVPPPPCAVLAGTFCLLEDIVSKMSSRYK